MTFPPELSLGTRFQELEDLFHPSDRFLLEQFMRALPRAAAVWLKLPGGEWAAMAPRDVIQKARERIPELRDPRFDRFFHHL